MDNYNFESNIFSPEEIIKKGRRGYSICAFGMFTFGIVATIFQILLQIAVILYARFDSSIISAPWLDYIFILVPMYLIAFPVSRLVFKIAPKAPLRDEKMPVSTLVAIFVMIIPLTLILNIFSIVLADVLSEGTATNPLSDLVTDVNIWQVGTVVILGPIVEELIFRKLVIDRTRQFGEKLSIFFSAFCFGLFHMNIFQIFYAFAIGLLLAYIYTRTGRIRYTIILHMLFNFWGSVVPLIITSIVPEDLLNMLESGDTSLILSSASQDQLTGLFLYCLYVLIEIGLFIAGVILWFIFLTKKKFQLKPAPYELPKGKKFTSAFITLGFLFFFALCIYGTITNFLS